MRENIVYLFSVNRWSRFEVDHMRPSDYLSNCTGTMTLKELESHWNNKKNGGITMDYIHYWVKIY